MVVKEKDKDSSDDTDDDETLARLREAVDSDTLKESLYSEKYIDKNELEEGESASDLPSVALSSEDQEDPLALSKFCKQLIVKSRSIKIKSFESSKNEIANSLRRDKQDFKPVISELPVTPGFQKFWGKKLDQILDAQIEDIEGNSTTKRQSDNQPSSCIKLLKISKRTVTVVDDDLDLANRKRPDLLAHTKVPPSYEDLSSCAVSGERILSGEETKGWVNKFANRVEPGVENRFVKSEEEKKGHKRAKKKRIRDEKRRKKSDPEAGCETE